MMLRAPLTTLAKSHSSGTHHDTFSSKRGPLRRPLNDNRNSFRDVIQAIHVFSNGGRDDQITETVKVLGSDSHQKEMTAACQVT
jgi:hypothetical protein